MSKTQPKQIHGSFKRKIDSIVETINRYYQNYFLELKGLDVNVEEDRFKAQSMFVSRTKELKEELQNYLASGMDEQMALTRILPRAFANVKAAAHFLWNKPHYDVQLIGGILLNDNTVAQMATGEGKTLAATLPAYLNALVGKGTHVITPNGYLAKRDYEEMSELYNLLGLSCGLVEERGKEITQEELIKRANEVLNREVEERLKGITDPLEYQSRKAFVLKHPQNVLSSQRIARRELQKEKLQNRRKAYEKDITYGSAKAFAFDYLFDDIAIDADGMVLREGKPYFAIVDEVDAVLFDDAVMPFILAGQQRDEELAIADQEIESINGKIQKANESIFRIYRENEEFMGRGGKSPLIYTLNDKKEYESLLELDEDEELTLEMTHALIVDLNSKQYHLTLFGETIIFQQFYSQQVADILFANRDRIISMKKNDSLVFRKNIDYVIDSQGQITMEPHAFAYLVTNELLPELSNLFAEFQIGELVEHRHEIDNAIRAWFVLRENIDYKLSVPTDAKNPLERSVTLVQNGRTAEGRVYAEGLQQAVEAKEQLLKENTFQIRETKMNNTLSSIPTASFFERYTKIGGMTGTAAVSAFDMLYGLETYEVPRNRPKQVTDYGERMYATRDAKINGIFNEVLASYRKGQPVLITTTSIEESRKLHDILKILFQQNGIPIQIPVLNANISNLELEANIISKAGMPGAITISTEMAGRGTDIKLGGEIPDVDDLIQVISAEIEKNMLESMRQKGSLTSANYSALSAKIKRIVTSNQNIIVEEAKKRYAALSEKRDGMAKKILASGGLKVIGSGHFANSRIDNQIKGRCGRQGDRGEVIFFNDPQDLRNIGVPTQYIVALENVAKDGPYIEKSDAKIASLANAIHEAQHRRESATLDAIYYGQETARTIANLRNELRLQKDQLKRSGEYMEVVERLISGIAETIVERASHMAADQQMISKSNMDFDALIILSNNFLGISLDRESIEEFETIGELKNYIQRESFRRLQEQAHKLGSQKMQEQYKKVVDLHINRAWKIFEEYVEELKEQRKTNVIAKFQANVDMSAQIKIAFNHCVESESAAIVRDLIFPEHHSQLGFDPLMEISPLRITSTGFQEVSRDYDRIQNELVEQQKNSTSLSSQKLQLYPGVFRRLNKGILFGDSDDQMDSGAMQESSKRRI